MDQILKHTEGYIPHSDHNAPFCMGSSLNPLLHAYWVRTLPWSVIYLQSLDCLHALVLFSACISMWFCVAQVNNHINKTDLDKAPLCYHEIPHATLLWAHLFLPIASLHMCSFAIFRVLCRWDHRASYTWILAFKKFSWYPSECCTSLVHAVSLMSRSPWHLEVSALTWHLLHGYLSCFQCQPITSEATLSVLILPSVCACVGVFGVIVLATVPGWCSVGNAN